MTELDKFDRLIDKLGDRADEILKEIDNAKKDAIKEQYAEIADEMCKHYCIVPRLYCYDGKTNIEGMSKHCDNCPLLRGYRLCITS